MEITATELKLNLGKYLEAANDEVIVITKNGKAIAKLIGTRSYKYDFSELEEFEAQIKKGAVLGEAPAHEYGTESGFYTAGDSKADTWLLTHNGEPVAQLKPFMKQKRKRILGFLDGPPVSEETNAALFESDFSGEDYERWLNEEL
jgi:prevent-host-death family protein